MSKVVSTKQQLETLVSIMEKNPNLAKGVYTKAQAAKRWEEISMQLNSLGPPIPMTAKWVKIWADMKSKTKRKMSENKVEYRATGGGPNTFYTFSNAEEAIIGLLNLETSIDPPGQEHGLGEDRASDIILEEPLENVDIEEYLEESGPSGSVPEDKPQGSKRKRCTKTSRLQLLEEQTKSQKMFHKEMLEKMEVVIF